MEKPKKAGMSLVDLFTLGFGAIIGVGWSMTLNNMFINGGGPVPAILGFAIATLCFIPVALCFAELTPAMPVAGGVVAYVFRAMGSKMSFVSGWFVAMAYISLLPWEAIAINNILVFIFPSLQSGRLLYTLAGADIYLNALIVGLAVAALVIFLNWRGVQGAAAFQTFLTFFLIIGSAVCVVFALFKLDPANLTPIYSTMEGKNHTSFLTGILTMLALAPFYYAGFDTIPQGAEEAGGVDPKSLGKVIIGALLSAGAFYIIIFLSMGFAYPWQEFVVFQKPALSNLMAALYSGFLGRALFWLSLAATLAGLFTTWNGFFIAGSRLLLGMGRARLLPAFFATVHPKHGTPYGGSIFCSLAMLAGPFLGIGLVDPLTILGSTGFVVGWGMACLSAVVLYKKEPDMPRPYRMPGGVATAWTGTIICALMFINCVVPGLPGYMGSIGMGVFVGWCLLGLVFYVFNGKYRSTVSEEEMMAELFRSVRTEDAADAAN